MLTTRMQIQALADRLAGLPAAIHPSALTDPWKACWQAIDAAPAGQSHTALVEALGDSPDRDWVIGAIISARPGETSGVFPSLLELAPGLRPIAWLWPGWIPRGMITLLGAIPGAGKSFLALDLARRIIQGEPFPDGQPVPRPGGNILYVDAEAVPQLLNERARAWGMDRSHLFLMLPEPGAMLDFCEPAHRDRLIEMAHCLSPELIILDSLSSISTRGENNVEDVRLLLGFLNQLAQDSNAGLLLIHHLKKGSGQQVKLWDLSLDDFRGSSHIVAIARSVMGLSIVQACAEPDRNGPRKLEIVKTNLGPFPGPLGFEFAPLHPSGVRLRWGEAPKPYQEPTQLQGCKEWLEALLRQEELRPAEVIELGKREGYRRSLIYQAREELGGSIQNSRGRRHPKNTWRWAAPGPDELSEESEEFTVF